MKIIYLKSTGEIKQTFDDEVEVTVTERGFETYKSLFYLESNKSASDYGIAQKVSFEDGYNDTNYLYIGGELVYSRKTKIILLRAKRDELLQKSDRTCFSIWADRWSKLTEECQGEWSVYRQKLRDLVNLYERDTEKDIDNVEWPEEPKVVFKTV